MKNEGLDFGEPILLLGRAYFYPCLLDNITRELGLNTAISCSVILFRRPLESVYLKSFHFYYFC